MTERLTKVLVVDDDPEDVEIVDDFLREIEGEEYRLTHVTSYEAGLEALDSTDAHVCLVDYRMGAHTGVDFIREAARRRPDVPAVLFTGQTGHEVDRQAMAAGAVDFLAKSELSPSRLERTLRYAVERARRHRAEARFRALIEHSHDMVAILAPDGTLDYVSPSLSEMLGYDPGEKLGASSLLEVHPDDRERVTRELVDLVAEPQGSQRRLRYQVRHRDGGWRMLDTVATNHISNPAIGGIVTHSWDVTRELESQERIRFQAELLGAVGQAVIATDLEGNVVYWNPAAERMYGWSAEEVAGRSVYDVTVPRMSRSQATEIMRALTAGRSWTGEFRVARKDGSTFPALITNSPILGPDGQATGVIGVSSDITALKETEAALRDRVKEVRTLHRTGEIMNDPDLETDDKLQRVVRALPPAWSNPASTEARLVLDGRTFTTSGFRETEWMLSADIQADERTTGRIDVALLEEPTDRGAEPFLKEGRDLLLNVARVVGQSVARDRLTRLLASTVAALDEAVLVVRDRTVLDANPAAERMFGYGRDELVGDTTEKIHVDHDAYERFGREVLGQLRDEGVFRGTFRFRRKDDSHFDSELTLTLLDPSAGLDGGLVGAVRDISERVRAEEELRASEERFRQIAEHVQDAFWIMSIDRDQLEYISPAFEKIWGRSVQELRDDPEVWARSLLPSDHRRILTGMAGQLDGPHVQEYRIVRPDGEIRWIHDRSFPVRDGSGEIVKLVGVAEDITDRKMAEERFAVLSQEIADAIHVIGPDGQILSATPSAESVLGYPVEELVGMSALELVHPEDADEPRRLLRQIIHEPGAVARSQFRVVTREGEVRHVESVGRNRLDHPAIGGVVVTTRDVTERRRLEEQLRQSQKMEAIGRLAGGVAHDFNNLLTVIRSQTDLLLMDMEADDPLTSELQTIQASADRAAQLTSQLLAFSRDQVLQPRVVDLSEVVRDMARLLERVISEDIALVSDLATDLPAMRVDPGQLEQAVLNLAVNARDAMPDGGTLTLRTRPVRVSPEEADEEAGLFPGDHVVLEVEDTGLGMDAETRSHIFEPFFTTKEKGKGTGLGLSMVYGLVRQSGGSVSVRTEPGQGSTFRLSFPAVGEAVEQGPAAAPIAAAPPEKLVARILVVEDDMAVRRVTTKILERAGLVVQTVEDAESGLEALGTNGDFDLVLTDLVLPGMSGRSLVDRLLERPTRPGIIVMSGYAEDSPGHRGDLPEEVAFIPKPFSPAALIDTIRKALSRG